VHDRPAARHGTEFPHDLHFQILNLETREMGLRTPLATKQECLVKTAGALCPPLAAKQSFPVMARSQALSLGTSKSSIWKRGRILC